MLSYLRVYADADGESHFEDVELPGEQRRAATTTAVSVYAEPIPLTGMILRQVVEETAPDEFHTAPRRQFVVHFAGRAEIEVSDGERRVIGPGDLVLFEDTTGKGHIARNAGPGPRTTAFLVLDQDWPGP